MIAIDADHQISLFWESKLATVQALPKYRDQISVLGNVFDRENLINRQHIGWASTLITTENAGIRKILRDKRRRLTLALRDAHSARITAWHHRIEFPFCSDEFRQNAGV